MKSMIVRTEEGKKYDIRFNDKGEAIAYFVEVYPRGKRTSWRLLWSVERHGWVKGDIPAKLKEITNQRGFADQLARVMEW